MDSNDAPERVWKCDDANLRVGRDSLISVAPCEVWANRICAVVIVCIGGSASLDVARAELAVVLRTTAEAFRGAGASLPVFGIAWIDRGSGERSSLDMDQVRRLAHDVDWHRGDFGLLTSETLDEAKEKARQLLVPIHDLDIRGVTAEPVADDATFLRQLEAALDAPVESESAAFRDIGSHGRSLVSKLPDLLRGSAEALEGAFEEFVTEAVDEARARARAPEADGQSQT